MSKVAIRDARPEDDAVIGEILVRAYVEQYARMMPHVVVHDARKADLRNVAEKRAMGRVLVAELAEPITRVVGSMTLLPPGAIRSEAWLEKMADIRMLGIDLHFRGHGIADALLTQAEQVARREWSCEWLGLHVRRGAEGVARLYQKHGFERDFSGDMDKLPEIFLEAYKKRLS